ncbi:MAG: glycine zipper 2TM domain-containing protein [Alcanivoracaceae bacterium]|nr:glycine zipper 2TM domain-containing protein [Alcanivoracaceae bacterium]
MKTAAIAVLSAASTVAAGGAGYGLYQAGASQAQSSVAAAPVAQPLTEEQIFEARVQAAVAAALEAREAAPAVAATVASVPAPVAVTGTITVHNASAPAPVRAPARARVLHVEPISTSWQEPREVCQWVTVQKPVPVQQDGRIARTLLGAAAGGLLGNQIGGGSGKQVATVIGALAGAQVGSQTGDRAPRTISTTEQQCSTVMESRSRASGYLVSYEYQGQIETIRTSREPGAYLPVENGRVVF